MKSKWTKEEMAILRKLYPHTEMDVIYKSLPNRSDPAIRNKAFELNIFRFLKSGKQMPKKKRPMEVDLTKTSYEKIYERLDLLYSKIENTYILSAEYGNLLSQIDSFEIKLIAAK